MRSVTGVEALAAYSDADEMLVARYTVVDGEIELDALNGEQLRRWVDGHDPVTDTPRGRELTSPDADLLLDGTINAPKSFSIAALLHPEIAAEFEALQDRLRDRIITTWQRELNARRGAGGRIREDLQRVEVVELRHRRSRALDPHIHRHLWLNVKVQGVDGKWSNVDSRVAMKLHTLINAEGDLAARTDPEWIAALARHGYTLNADGEIAQIAHAVRPLSRRANQIEANRAVLLLRWRQQHPGQEPSPAIMQQLDRQAWATGRPNKPGVVDEQEWEGLVRDELVAIDPGLIDAWQPVPVRAATIGGLDLELLAARTIVDADARSTPYGGRLSDFDLRAGATRALAASGLAAARDNIQPVIDEVVRRAHLHTLDLLDIDPQRPGHVKAFIATSTAALKIELAEKFAALTHQGSPSHTGRILSAASEVLPDGIQLDAAQVDAAAAVAGTDRLVSITGPAGAGKTTMLRTARAALAHDRRRLLVVAPTKKAASVAGREVGAVASSLHALLADHGWRWDRDGAGAEQWTRLRAGEMDATTGRVYTGPRQFVLRPGDRIVVDEAGMVDLRTATALATLVAESGVGLAMVGDELQAMPVGHAGAMALLTRSATAVVELTAVHRFHDPAYAALSLRMRHPASKNAALVVAADLDLGGHVLHVRDGAEARDHLVDSYFAWTSRRKRVGLVTGTNEEADAINEAIQQRRLDLAQITDERIAIGQGEQRIVEGDIVQTRLNDRIANVENRALWTVRRILPDGIELASVTDAGLVRRVDLDYAADHVHLAYASTVHGIQGETTDVSVVGPGVDAAGLYVGMTRGRQHNEAITLARDAADARNAIAEAMLRGSIEVTLDDSVHAARAELGRAARPADDGETDIDEMREWMDAAGRTIAREGARAANDEAASHAREKTAADAADPRVAALHERLDATAQQYDDLLLQLAAPTEQTRRVSSERVDVIHRPVVVGSGRSLSR